MCGRIIAVSEYSRVRYVKRQEILEPHLLIIRRPCLLPMAVEAVDSDNASTKAFQNVKNTQQSQLTLLAGSPLRPAVSDQARHPPRRLLRYRP